MSKIRGGLPNNRMERKVHNWLKGNRIKHKMYPRVEGNPDLFLTDSEVYVFLDGCFWHCCPLHFRLPKSNVPFWMPKFWANVERDMHRFSLPYRWVSIWEHEVKDGSFKTTLTKLGSSR